MIPAVYANIEYNARKMIYGIYRVLFCFTIYMVNKQTEIEQSFYRGCYPYVYYVKTD